MAPDYGERLCSLGLRCYLRCLLDLMLTMGTFGPEKDALLLFSSGSLFFPSFLIPSSSDNPQFMIVQCPLCLLHPA
jgi:hypothetical protein